VKRILVVDDMSSLRSLIKAVINDLGSYTVDEASNGVVALQKLKQQHYDLVISDWNMPMMSGIELLGAIRNDDALKTIPVIMLTAETTKDNIQKAVSLGINGYITKPFTPELLISSLKRLMWLGLAVFVGNKYYRQGWRTALRFKPP
jgi:two-component system chemotaxis response regulator CheY